MPNEENTLRNKRKELSDILGNNYNGNKLLDRIRSFYFEPKYFEKNGRIYELLGVKLFKNMLLSYSEKHGRSRSKELKGSNYYLGADLSEDSLKKFESKTRYNEKVHLVTGLLFAANSIFNFAMEENLMGITFTLPAIIDLYLISLQRYNRTRIYEILSRRNAKKLKKPIID
ncbi:MAG: hypothetical protein WCK29_02450 [archaeon]